MKPINLCEGCAGGSYRKCARTSDEQYYGVTGAFRCLVESKYSGPVMSNITASLGLSDVLLKVSTVDQ